MIYKPTEDEINLREKMRSEIKERTQAVLQLLEPHHPVIRSFILDQIEYELAIRNAAMEAVHRPVSWAQRRDEGPLPDAGELHLA